ncbi:unnamed protein product [Rotaria sp. Silwood2]|nr:unnamed protein product [Rotaria sp. Silwood2]CAF4268878.1 unnamed protein product [Rotaria sp. Silwood2]CAF4286713.1 unnamed protein product [Rotaria sp. Silwood2]CAF4621038.1 unnamed protein product [Rotaria sp. Silwood2]
MKVMFDSGATTSFISKAALKQTTHLPIRFTQQHYLMADGYTTFDVIGTVKIFIEFNQMKTSIVVRVVNSLSADCILGMDYINKYKVNLNNKDKQIQIHTFNNKITIPMEDQAGSIRMSCRLINPTCIYPYQEKRIKISTQMSSGQLLFSPAYHLIYKKGLISPYSSISVMNHVAWISIYNPTSKVCYLKRNIIVGVAVSPHITSAVINTTQAKEKTNPHKLVDINPTSATTSSTDDQPQKVVGHAFNVFTISKAQKGDKLYQEKVLELKRGQTNCSYILNDGILYKLFKHNTFIQKLIYIPSTILPELLKAYHVVPWAGHSGFRRTYFKLKHKYWCPDMKTTIKNYIQSCSKCQDFNASRHQTDLPSEKPKAIYTFDKSNDYFPYFTRTLSNWYQNSQTNIDQRQTYNRIIDRNRVNMYCNVGTQELKRLSHSSSKPSPIYSRSMRIIKQQIPTQ